MQMSPQVYAAIALLTLSYGLLLVALLGNLVEYNYSVTLQERWFEGAPDKDVIDAFLGFMSGMPLQVIPVTSRSLLGGDAQQPGLVQWLWREAKAGRCSYFPPMALVFFGVGLPCLKLLLIIVWALRPELPQWLLAVAAQLSRWAAADALAEAMLVGFLLKAGIDARHCFGFVAFVAYCILSTLSLWLLEGSSFRNYGTEAIKERVGTVRKFFQLLCNGGPSRGLLLISLLLFLGLFGSGACMPIGNLSVTEAAVEADLVNVIAPYKPLVTGLLGLSDQKVTELVMEFSERIPKPATQASLLQVVKALLTSGHAFTFVGSLLLFIGVLVLPILQAGLFFNVAWRSSGSPEELPLQAAGESSGQKWMLRLLKGIDDFVLLDVFVIGLFVGVAAISSIDMLQADLLRGYYLLLGAALAAMVHKEMCEAALSASSAQCAEVMS